MSRHVLKHSSPSHKLKLCWRPPIFSLQTAGVLISKHLHRPASFARCAMNSLSVCVCLLTVAKPFVCFAVRARSWPSSASSWASQSWALRFSFCGLSLRSRAFFKLSRKGVVAQRLHIDDVLTFSVHQEYHAGAHYGGKWFVDLAV